MVAELREAQWDKLWSQLVRMPPHGVHKRELQKEGVDVKATHRWLKDGRLRPALVMAAQDQVLHTAAYQAKVMKKTRDPKCRACGQEDETVAHILAACPKYKWGLRKQRHDRVLYQLVMAVADRLGLRVPRVLRGKEGGVRSGVFGSRGKTLLVDQHIPTDRATQANRPDLVVRLEKEKRIICMDVAVAWEPLVRVREREAEKQDKYQELAADLAQAWEGYRVLVVLVVVGTLGLVRDLRTHLKRTGLIDPAKMTGTIGNLQREAICGGVKMLRRHMAVYGDED